MRVPMYSNAAVNVYMAFCCNDDTKSSCKSPVGQTEKARALPSMTNDRTSYVVAERERVL